MAKTIEQLKAQSAEVKNASVIGENTATRVGSLFNDIVEHVEAYEAGQAQKDTEQSTSINAETARATTAETTLSARINQEVTDRKAMDETIGIQLSDEIERAKGMELGISTKLDDEIKRATEAENNLQEKITSEAEARDLAINAETQARTQNDQLLSQAIAAEQERAEAAEKANAQGIIYDVSAHNDGAVFESLSALLSSSNLSTLIPTSVRRGGMSIRFVQSSDNKYVQYRLMAQNFTTDTTQWQGVIDTIQIGDRTNIVNSNGIANGIINALDKGVFTTDEFRKKYYIHKDDGIITYFDNNQIAVSNFISLEGISKIEIHSATWIYGNSIDYAFYDSQKQFISGGKYLSTDTIFEKNDFPNGAEYIVFGALNTNEDFSSYYAKLYFADLIFKGIPELQSEVKHLSKSFDINFIKGDILSNPFIYGDIDFVNPSWNNTTQLLIDNRAIPSSIGCVKIKFATTSQSASIIFGFGYYDDNSKFVVIDYKLVSGTAVDGVIEQLTRISIERGKVVHAFVLVKTGNIRFNPISKASYSVSVALTGEGAFAAPIEIDTTVTSNGINFAEFCLVKDIEGVGTCDVHKNSLYVTNDGRFGYSTIQSAVDYAKTIMGANNPVTIFVGEGEFARFDLIGANNYISIIGVGREKTMVKSTTGLYATPAANIATNGIIKGITFISTHDDIESLDGDPGSYAVHSDMHYSADTGTRNTVYEDCDFISYQNSGFGAGVEGNEELVLRNCGFFSYYTREFNPLDNIHKRYASLLVHGAIHADIDPTKVIVEDCKGYSLSCDIAVFLDDMLSEDIVYEVRNSQFYSEVGGIAVFRGIKTTLSPLSYNNNIPSLNYNYNQ